MTQPTQKRRILVVGQTPPPFHGQAMMTQRLLEIESDQLDLFHVRMAFSKSVASVGSFQLSKVWHMIAVVAKIIFFRLRYRIPTLYYMPAGPNLTPIIRDIFILGLARPWFRRTVFHFRAAGLSDFVQQRSGVLPKLARRVYGSPNVAIHLSSLNPDDGGYFGAHQTVVVPNGLEDAAAPYVPIRRTPQSPVQILFVGVLCESKGVSNLLQATQQLREAGAAIHVSLMGEFNSEAFREETEAYCRTHDLTDTVSFVGVLSGDPKWEQFLKADIFCFPSHYESESFGNVAVEAMMFALPVVATQWRGIPDIVKDQETGLLVPPQNPSATAQALQILVEQPNLRQRMGQAGRERYLSHYRLPVFVQKMESTLSDTV